MASAGTSMLRCVPGVAACALMLVGCAIPAGSRAGTLGKSQGWAHFGNSLANTRYSGLRQLTADNVTHLRIVWTRSEGLAPQLWEDYPVVVGRTMYITTSTDEVEAVDAITGRVRWSYIPRVDFFVAGAGALPLATNRGVAVSEGRVYLTTFDDRLVALSAASGRQLWQTTIASPTLGYTETAGPTVYDGLVYVGNSSTGTGVRGFLAAFDAATGTRRWLFYTVPPPGQGWVPRRGHHGGGDAWMPPTIDPSTGMVYAATGNPTPDLVRSIRPGCDPHADSIVALTARTGRLVWSRSLVCADAWDYDTSQAPFYFTLRLGGRAVRVVADGSKSGRLIVLDALTGHVVSESPYLTPYTAPHLTPTTRGVRVCPGAFGGLEYSPPSYDPVTGSVYLDGVRACMRYTSESAAAAARHRRGHPDVGGSYTLLRTPRPIGYLAAVDPATGRTRWEDRLPLPSVGGTLATAGGLVFTGDDNGKLYAAAARSGRILWSIDLRLPMGSAPFTYAVAGRQYLAVVAGGSQLAVVSGLQTGGRLVVFDLAGDHAPRRRVG